MKQSSLLLFLGLVLLCGCDNRTPFSGVEAHYGISGYVVNSEGDELNNILVVAWLDGEPVDNFQTDTDGYFWIGGECKGNSLYWLTTIDLEPDSLGYYSGDSVMVVLDYRGGNGRSNLGNGTATANLTMTWVAIEPNDSTSNPGN